MSLLPLLLSVLLSSLLAWPALGQTRRVAAPAVPAAAPAQVKPATSGLLAPPPSRPGRVLAPALPPARPPGRTGQPAPPGRTRPAR